jgi:hypothetical protein
MGISRPSLYAAFGNKERLFERVVDRYNAGEPAYKQAALGEPTVRQVVTECRRRNADAITSPEHPSGCLVVQSAVKCALRPRRLRATSPPSDGPGCWRCANGSSGAAARGTRQQASTPETSPYT